MFLRIIFSILCQLILIDSIQSKLNLNDIENIIEDKIFWSKSVENIVPIGFTDLKINNWIDSLNETKFINVHYDCGRMQNRLLITDRNQSVCVRYRKNNDQILGEYYSFLLARMLQIDNVLPTTLFYYEPNQFKDRYQQIVPKLQDAQWDPRLIVLTKYLDQLDTALIAKPFRNNKSHLYPNSNFLNKLTKSELKELVQWSDLIIFDYLTANTDRIINNMINKHWNPKMMDNPAHNLLKQNDLLIFLDNESGLFHGYRLLKRYESLHRSLLDSVCIFRRRTINNIEQYSHLNPNQLIKLMNNRFGQFHRSLINSNQNSTLHHSHLYIMPIQNVNILLKRMRQVLKQVDVCRNKFK